MPRHTVEYDEKFCQQLIEHCAQGFSPTAFAGAIRVSRAVMLRWADLHLDFKDAMGVAQTARAAWLEEQSCNIVMNGGTGGQATLLIFKMKNAMPEDYRDRQEITGAEGKPLIEDSDPKRLAATLLEILKEASPERKDEKDKNIKGFGENEEGRP
jgi:hypothetical protein